MTCEAKGNLRHRARTKTALATTALVAGGYLVMSGTIAEPAAGQSSNAAQKGGQLIAEPDSGSEARKEGKLTATGESSNEVRKGGKLVAAGAGNKEGKLNPASPGASPAEPQYQEKYNTEATSSQVDPQIQEKYNTEATSSQGKSNPTSPVATNIDGSFLPGPQYGEKYNAEGNVDIYGAKSNVDTPRPPIEVGRQQYTSGGYEESSTIFGALNPLLPGLAVYGDWRTAIAYNQNNGNDIAQIATRVNIDVDLKLTGTERIHAFFTPLQDNARFTRFEFGGGGVDEEKFQEEFDFNPQTLFFEGDLGAITAGFTGEESSFDLPFTVGLFPLFLQNGIWANDAILGGAFSLTAKNSPLLGIPNYDVTFFAAFDNVDNRLVVGDVANRNNNVSNLYGVTAFIDAYGGYIEAGYGLVQGFDEQDGLLVNFLTGAYTRRYYNTVSNTTRVFGNFGEAADGSDKEVDGLAIISENSIISGLPSTLLPYANFFVGFGAPEPLVDGNGAGILKNVGINFETDALTGFPKLDDTGADTYGGAIGLQYLFNLDQQLVFEVATVQPHSDSVVGAQYGFGVRYQIPLNNVWLLRADATYQILEDAEEDNFGIRTEIRRKF
jgi:hypothetical protein